LGNTGALAVQCRRAARQVRENGAKEYMVDEELLKILVCPENKTPVHLADVDLVVRVNAAIEAGTLKNRAGEEVDTAIEGGLVREDRAYLYPIREDIPVMLIDEGIPLAQINEA
jgi:uncharacterized protein YbaR (Trm112 family)